MGEMQQSWETLVQHFRFADAIDLATGTLLLTLLFHWLRNHSARIVIIVICATAAFYLTAHALRMYLMMTAFRMGLWVILFALIVVFQEDIRNGFEKLTVWPPSFLSRQTRPQLSVDALANAVELLALEGTGALIVLPARQQVDRLLQGGELVNGQISVPLLHSIFHSGSQGHDGAVIVRSNRVWKLGVHLPLSTNFEVLGARGTRHAAALGLAERCDALVIVVSEERGEVSIAQNRNLITLAEPAQVRDYLEQSLVPRHASRGLRWIVPRALRLLTFGSCAFLITAFFWYLVANRVDQVQRIVDRVPIETSGVPTDWVIESIQPERVRVNLTGSERAFSAFDWNELKFRLKLAELEDGTQSVVLSDEGIELPAEMQVQQIEPNVIYITAYRTQIVELPVSVEIQGALPEGIKSEQLVPTPDRVLVRVPSRALSEIQSIPTEALKFSEIQSRESKEMKLVLPPNVVPIEDTPTSVTVQIPAAENQEDESSKAPER